MGLGLAHPEAAVDHYLPYISGVSPRISPISPTPKPPLTTAKSEPEADASWVRVRIRSRVRIRIRVRVGVRAGVGARSSHGGGVVAQTIGQDRAWCGWG